MLSPKMTDKSKHFSTYLSISLQSSTSRAFGSGALKPNNETTKSDKPATLLGETAYNEQIR